MFRPSSLQSTRRNNNQDGQRRSNEFLRVSDDGGSVVIDCTIPEHCDPDEDRNSAIRLELNRSKETASALFGP